MAFNGSGTYNLPAGNPVVTGTTISSTWANTTLSDVATALTNCVTRDGQSPATANLPLGGFKLTNVGQATAIGDALAWGKNASVSGLVLGTISGLLKGSSGTVSAATSGTDYAPATSGSAILKGNGLGGFSSAVSGTDYAPATSGSSILYGSGSGGFSNVLVGTGLSFSAGTLNCTVSGGSQIVQGTAQTTNGAAAYGYTGIPSWVKKITFLYNGIDTNAGGPIIQLGSGSYTTSGYNQIRLTFYNATINASTTYPSGFLLENSSGYTGGFDPTGVMVLTLLSPSSNTWLAQGATVATDAGSNYFYNMTGSVTLAGTLDRIQITATSGTFTNGSVNIIYEG